MIKQPMKTSTLSKARGHRKNHLGILGLMMIWPVLQFGLAGAMALGANESAEAREVTRERHARFEYSHQNSAENSSLRKLEIKVVGPRVNLRVERLGKNEAVDSWLFQGSFAEVEAAVRQQLPEDLHEVVISKLDPYRQNQ